MRKTLGVCLLILLLTDSAVAGEIPNDAPAPPLTSATQEPTGGEMQNGIMGNDVTDSLTQAALDLLALLL
jgi:hypothetical protein